MSQSKIRQAIGAVKDQTSISLAKVASSTALADLDIAIVKATRHEQYPAEERYIREILSLTTYSRSHIAACVGTISRRLNKTKNWVVALKALILIQRLLSDGDPAYEQEFFFATRRGTRLLNMSDFRDTTKADSWDYSAFVRTYALYLDEQLECRMQDKRGKGNMFAYIEEDEEANQGATTARATPVQELTNGQIFSRIHHYMQLLERFLACRPTGAARTNRIVIVALYPIVKDSFQIYYDISEATGVLIDRFMVLDIPDSVKVYEIFCRVSKQYDELDSFYEWTKSVGVVRTSEYPDVDKITQQKLDAMDEFIREKSVMLRNRMAMNAEVEPVEEKEEEPEEDLNAMKTLPPPEGFVEETVKAEAVEVKVEEPAQEIKVEPKRQDVGDLLNLGADAPTSEEQSNRLALALFDGGPSTATPTVGTSAWEAFNNTGDWETALVQTASHLANQKSSLPGGFDTLMLDGMYQQGAIKHAMASSGMIATGSASSVALGSAGRPAMLALPAPPTAGGGAQSTSGADPFAASLGVPPPAYVQMSELEKKHQLLMKEQLMWQQYARNGMQGEVSLAKLQQQNAYPYNNGGYAL
ncbi:hypothetical protein DCAR_0624365 [Daucus carota subsp. sativus]|uniref:ENTH domain-containing protein n=1 Tax=Daucus carota subsp. sativus TaxID=79200 RepID=A0A161ZVB0_DAUCS|nr:PREDICTED: putative clathrin assembly protein At1g03050 [Daucus carota subsp. sativus]WOH04953.1 hypothetical protein DCAR_0624365 [Daucus carota subsp. sativus]